MKYWFFIISLLALFSCGNPAETNETDEETEPSIFQFDTYTEKISYCIGLDHGRGCYNAYSAENVASAFNMREIEKGMVDYLVGNELRFTFFEKDSILDIYLLDDGSVNEQAVNKNDASYCVGVEEAFSLVSMLVARKIDQEVFVDFMVQGIQEAMQNKENPTIPYMDARKEVQDYYADLNRDNGAAFLAENKMIEGVVETESGLQFEIIKEGTGISPNITDSVTVHYTGRHIDGRVFESTIPSNIPYVGSLMNVIRGWQEGITMMKEGGQRRLYVPHELAYGEAGKGVIEPYSTLVFDIELVKVKRFQ